MEPTARIFATGRRDPVTEDVVLSRKPADWQGLLDAAAKNRDEGLLVERRPAQTPHARRDPFEGGEE